MKRSIAIHYLEVKTIGLKNIPKDGPLLIAATHPNSFLDAILIAIAINRPLHFLARSDVFRANWANKVLRSMNLIPIYRLQEGVENLNKNEETFKECYDILDQDGAILIFAEGLSEIDKKLRPLKKGLARIAFGYLQRSNFSRNCKIVPLSLNYDRPTDFRSKILIGIDKAICVSDFEDSYVKNKNQGIIDLNKVLFKSLQNHTIEVEDENILVYKTVTELDSGFTENSLARKILIANQIHKAQIENSNQLNALKEEAVKAFTTLKSYGLNFRKLKVNKGINYKRIVTLFITLPFAVVALILNGLPFLIAKKIAHKKVKIIEFYASVRLVSGSILWLVWGLILTLVGVYFFWFFIFTIPLLYLLLQIYLEFYEKQKYVKSAWRLKKLRESKLVYEALQIEIKNIYRLRKILNLTRKEDI